MKLLLTLVVIVAAGLLGYEIYCKWPVAIIAAILTWILFRFALAGAVIGIIISIVFTVGMIILSRRTVGPYELSFDSLKELLPVMGVAFPFTYALDKALLVINSSGWMKAGVVILTAIIVMELLVNLLGGRVRRWVIVLVVLIIIFLALKGADFEIGTASATTTATEVETKTKETSSISAFFDKMFGKKEPEAEVETKVKVQADEPKLGETGVSASWYAFYNLSLQKDNNTKNDYNFGEDLKALNPNVELTAKNYDLDFRERIKIDPALGAADMAWFDAILGTRYLGVFYEECKGNWATTMNSAKDYWCEHQLEYYQTLDAFFAFLDSGTVSLKEGSGIQDQMYMNPNTASKIPDIIVKTTDQESGLFLVYTLTVKGNTFEVMYRTECGYQPTNVEEVMNITPQNKSTDPTPSPSPVNPTPSPSPVNPTPAPSPTPTPSNPKDPTKGTQGDPVKPNDDKGPGEDTNNGVGATESKKDRDDTSTSYDSYEDYREDMNELEDINDTQKTGDDKNTPSIIVSPSTDVDNNGDKGTGNGGINEPTPTAPVVTEADTGKTIDETPGEAWGGPPD